MTGLGRLNNNQQPPLPVARTQALGQLLPLHQDEVLSGWNRPGNESEVSLVSLILRSPIICCSLWYAPHICAHYKHIKLILVLWSMPKTFLFIQETSLEPQPKGSDSGRPFSTSAVQPWPLVGAAPAGRLQWSEQMTGLGRLNNNQQPPLPVASCCLCLRTRGQHAGTCAAETKTYVLRHFL